MLQWIRLQHEGHYDNYQCEKRMLHILSKIQHRIGDVANQQCKQVTNNMATSFKQ